MNLGLTNDDSWMLILSGQPGVTEACSQDQHSKSENSNKNLNASLLEKMLSIANMCTED